MTFPPASFVGLTEITDVSKLSVSIGFMFLPLALFQKFTSGTMMATNPPVLNCRVWVGSFVGMFSMGALSAWPFSFTRVALSFR